MIPAKIQRPSYFFMTIAALAGLLACREESKEFSISRHSVDSISTHSNYIQKVSILGDTGYFHLESTVDQGDLTTPQDYNWHSNETILVQHLSIRNTTGKTIYGFRPIFNDFDTRSFKAISKSIGLDDKPTLKNVLKFYQFWINNKFHGAVRLPESYKNPYYILNFLGQGLCGDDNRALTKFFGNYGIEARDVPLNGHGVNEFLIDSAWTVIDGDQNAIYFCLDNVSLASYADIFKDPLVAWRTHIHGKSSDDRELYRWKNMSIFEYFSPIQFSRTSSVAGLSDNLDINDSFSLPPDGELIYHFKLVPPFMVGKSSHANANLRENKAIRVIEQRLPPGSLGYGQYTVRSAFPIYEVQNTSKTDRIEVIKFDAILNPGESMYVRDPVFAVEIASNSETASASVFSQSTLLGMPRILKGENVLSLSGIEKTDSLEIKIVIDDQLRNRLPSDAPAMGKSSPKSQGKELVFNIPNGSKFNKLWYQISPDSSFALVCPNLDRIQAGVDLIGIDVLSQTFLNPHTPYFFRIKGLVGDIWTEWSSTHVFQVEKPEKVDPIYVNQSRSHGHFLKWRSVPGKAVKYHIFASKMRSCVPDLYATFYPSQIADTNVTLIGSTANTHFVTSDSNCHIPNEYSYFRIISEDNGVFGVPSELIEAPRAKLVYQLAKNAAYSLPSDTSAIVLQMRHSTIEGLEYPDGYRDIHFTEATSITYVGKVPTLYVLVEDNGELVAESNEIIMPSYPGEFWVGILFDEKKPSGILSQIRQTIRRLKWTNVVRMPFAYYDQYYSRRTLRLIVRWDVVN